MKHLFSMLTVTMFSILVQAQETSTAAAAAAPAGAPAAPPVWANFVPFIVILVVFYFFLIRPQSKRQSELKKFVDSLKVGDQVITQSGILGRVAGLNDHIVNLEIANNVQIKILKSQILSAQAALQNPANAKTAKA